MIHEQAIIDPSAKIGNNVTIGPWTLIGPNVEIGDDTWVGPHVVINGPTKIGKNNRIFQYASVGEVPQDKKYDEENTSLEIGDGNTIREFCTINRGTVQDNSVTKLGNHNWLMAYVHIAHDCIVGDHNIFANNATLAGHVKVGNYVTLGGFAGVHQFCKVGDYSFLAHSPLVIKDVPPYLMVAGNPAKSHGLNVEGLRRNQFSADTIATLKKAYKIIFRNNLTVEQALDGLKELVKDCQEVQRFIDFLDNTSRGIVR